MPPQDDPFPLVQRDVRAAWAALSAHPPPPPSERAARLSALQADLADLSTAVDIARADPARFGLTASDLSARSAFVSDMRRAISAYTATPAAAAAASTKAALFANHTSHNSTTTTITTNNNNQNTSNTTRTAGDANDGFVADQMRRQTDTLAEQDGHLDELATAVRRIGALGRDMHVELEAQGDMLDGLADGMDGTMSRYKRVRERLDAFVEMAGPRNFCTIVWLSVAFLVLTVLVVLT